MFRANRFIIIVLFLFFVIGSFGIIGTSEASEGNVAFQGTIGTRFTIEGSGFGIKKPVVYVEYEQKPGVIKKISAKVETWSDASITCLWTKKMSPGTYNLFVQPKSKGSAPIPVGTLSIMNPSIDQVTPSNGLPGDTITIHGKYFSSKKPKVYLEDPTSLKRKNCKVLTSSMDPLTGFSTLQFMVPKLSLSDFNEYNLIVRNAIGEARSSGGENSFTLTINKFGDGIVIDNLSGINCGDVCSIAYPKDTTVVLTASAEAGSVLTSWSLCDSVDGDECTVTMNADRTVFPTFSLSEFKFQPVTKLLDAKTMQYFIKQEGDTYFFDSQATVIMNLNAGDIMMSKIEQGILRRVSSVSIQNGLIAVQTTGATLEDAIEQGTIAVTETLTHAQLKSPVELIEGVKLRKALEANSVDFTFDIDLSIKDKTGDTITIKGRSNFNFDVDFAFTYDCKKFVGICIELPTVTEFKSIFTTSNTNSLSIEGKLNGVDEKWKISKVPLVWIVPTPIGNVNIKGDLYLGVKGEITATLGVATEVTYTAGSHYQKNTGWQEISNWSKRTATISNPDFSLTGSIKTYLGPQLAILIYGFTGPYAELDTYLKLEGGVSNYKSEWWRLGGGVEAKLGVKMEIFSWNVLDFSTGINIVDWIIGSGTIEDNPPSVPTNLSATTASSAQINLSWSASTDDKGISGYKVFRGGSFLKTVTGTETSTSDTGLSPNTTYCYKVAAVDTSNQESGKSEERCATTLSSGYSISGRVTLNGSGLSGVTMTLTGTASTTTDSNGNYNFTGAQNGSYTITPSKSGYTFTPSSRSIAVNNANFTGQDFTATQTTQTFTLTVTKSGTGSGTVTSSPAGINCGGTCQVSFNQGTPVTLTPTPATGSTFAGWSGACIGTGACIVTMDANKSVTATFTSGGYSISGRVTLNGSGLSGVTITLTGTESKSTTTDSNGNYAFGGAQNGSYTITPSKSGYTFNPSSRQITVNNADITGQDFTAATAGGYSISGTVTSGGIGLSGVTITLTGTGSSSITTDSNGNYAFTGAQNGSYTITPSKSGYTFTPSSRSITVNNANVTGQDFTATQITDGILSVSPSDRFDSSGTQGGPFTPSSKTYTLTNTGGTSINWTASKGQSWVSLSSTSGTLSTGGSTTVTVSINSNANSLSPGNYLDAVSFTNTTNGNGNATRTVNLTVTYSTPTITIGPTSLNFGSVQVGTCSTAVFAIQHVLGTGPASGTVSASPNPPFSITSGSNFSVSNGSAAEVTVRFCPTSSGTVSGTATVSSSANFTGTTTVTLTGTGTAPSGVLSVSPADRFDSYGLQGGPFSPSSKTYTLSNTGGSSINWTASKGKTWVSLSSTGGTLSPGGSTTVSVSINSNANSLEPGAHVDIVYFTNTTNGNGNTSRTVNLTVNYATPAITVGPTTLNFGDVQVGTCKTVPFWIQHVAGTGTASGTVSASPNPPFSISSGSSFTVSNGSAAEVTVRFCPTSSGTVSGTATVSSSANFTGTNTVTLTGTGFNPGWDRF